LSRGKQDTPGVPRAAPVSPPAGNERASERLDHESLVIGLALDVLAGKGFFEEPSEELITALQRLYRANTICQTQVRFTGDLLHDMRAARPGEYLAGLYELGCEERWQREHAPRWSCPCATTFGLLEPYPGSAAFFTLTADGLFDTQVTSCPRCARDLAKSRAEHADGQLGFEF
jgi:hypothetical protein